jgi:hypothetical protein
VGHSFSRSRRKWRSNLSEDDRRRFGRTIGIRDKDVHEAAIGAVVLQKYIPEDPSRYTVSGPRAEVEHRNPDGEIVGAATLRPTYGLYIMLLGQRVEATTACRQFIEAMTSLVVAVAVATGLVVP